MADRSGLVLVGGGRMGEALLAGLVRGRPAGSIAVVEREPARRDELAGRYGPSARVAADLGEALDGLDAASSGAVVAVKPPDVAAVCRELSAAGMGRALSIAAGITLASLESWLGPTVALRAMPNTPALVGAGASGLAAGPAAGADDLDWARSVLETVGLVVTLPESSLDAVTGLSGSGPAYVFLLAEALIDAGVLVGLGRPVARVLAVRTLLGAARLLDETGDEPSALRAAVTSPGGTTAAGLRALEDRAVRAAVIDAVVASANRAAEMGRSV